VAGRIGAPGAHISLCQVGVSQQEMINTALTTITRGEADVVLVVGGEARAYARAGGVEEADDRRRLPTRPI